MALETLQASPQAAKEMADLLAKTAPATQVAKPPVIEEKVTEVVVPEVKPVEEKAEVVAEKKEETVAITEAEAPKKAWYEVTNTEKQVVAEVEDKTDYKSEYATLMADPLLKAIAEAKKAGKNVAEVIKELQPVDYKAMNNDQLIAAFGKLEGWSEDDISDEISKMEGKSLTEIGILKATWLNKLESNQVGKMENFTTNQKDEIEKQVQYEKHIQTTFEKDLKAECELMLANEINGVKLTKDHVNSFIKLAVEGSYTREDGTINMERNRFEWMGRNINEFMGAAKAEGISEGMEKVGKEIHRPNPQTSQPQRLPDVKQPLTKEQTATELIKARLGNR